MIPRTSFCTGIQARSSVTGSRLKILGLGTKCFRCPNVKHFGAGHSEGATLPLAAVVVVTLRMLSPSACEAASFRGLGALPGGSPPYSQAWDVSADGSVVVGESRSDLGIEGFRWTMETGMTRLGG